jgi:hypothetical protein
VLVNRFITQNFDTEEENNKKKLEEEIARDKDKDIKHYTEIGNNREDFIITSPMKRATFKPMSMSSSPTHRGTGVDFNKATNEKMVQTLNKMMQSLNKDSYMYVDILSYLALNTKIKINY